SGPCVASGYWRRPEVTEQTFAARTTDGQGPFLRTGDLGIVIDGQLYVTGRIKEVMIVRGRNIYPQDIEATVQRSHGAWRPAGGGVFWVERGDGGGIAVVREIERSWLATADRDELVSRISEAVFREHDIAVSDVVLTKPETVPKTSAGKIQRVLCRTLYQRGELERAIQGRSSKVVPITVKVPAEGHPGREMDGTLSVPAGTARENPSEAMAVSTASDAPHLAAGGGAIDAMMTLITNWSASHGHGVPSHPGQTFAEIGFDSVTSV